MWLKGKKRKKEQDKIDKLMKKIEQEQEKEQGFEWTWSFEVVLPRN